MRRVDSGRVVGITGLLFATIRRLVGILAFLTSDPADPVTQVARLMAGAAQAVGPKGTASHHPRAPSPNGEATKAMKRRREPRRRAKSASPSPGSSHN